MDKKSNIELMEESLKAVGWSKELIEAAIGVSSLLPPTNESLDILSVDFSLNKSETIHEQPSFTSHNYTQKIKVS